MDIPGFDPSTLTDDELVKLSSQLSGKLAFASRFSLSSEMLVQLRAMLDLVTLTRQDRALREQFQYLMKIQKPEVESDPIGGPKEEPTSTKIVRKPTQRINVMRTDKPVATVQSDTPAPPSKE